jgi:hypothetical protein
MAVKSGARLVIGKLLVVKDVVYFEVEPKGP